MTNLTAIPEAVSALRDDAARPEIETICARTRDELERIRPEWERVRPALGRATPNSNPDRVFATLEAMGERAHPHVTIFRRDGKPAALIVGRIAERRPNCRLGYLRPRTPKLRCFDIIYGGLVHDGSAEALNAVAEHLARVIESNEADHIIISRIPCDDGLHEVLGCFPRTVIERPILHWRCEFIDPETNAPAKFMSSKSRNTQRRHERKLHEAFDVELFIATAPEDVARLTREGVKIGERSYHAALGVGLRDDPVWRAIIARAAECGQLRSYILFGDGEPMSYVLGFVYDDTFFLEATGFRREYESHSPGTVLLWKIANDLREDGIRAIDFGFGDAEYKQRYGTSSWLESTIMLWGGAPKARLARLIDQSCRRGTSLAERVIGSDGRLARVKQWWRLRLERKRADA